MPAVAARSLRVPALARHARLDVCRPAKRDRRRRHPPFGLTPVAARPPQATPGALAVTTASVAGTGRETTRHRFAPAADAAPRRAQRRAGPSTAAERGHDRNPALEDPLRSGRLPGLGRAVRRHFANRRSRGRMGSRGLEARSGRHRSPRVTAQAQRAGPRSMAPGRGNWCKDPRDAAGGSARRWPASRSAGAGRTRRRKSRARRSAAER